MSWTLSDTESTSTSVITCITSITEILCAGQAPPGGYEMSGDMFFSGGLDRKHVWAWETMGFGCVEAQLCVGFSLKVEVRLEKSVKFFKIELCNGRLCRNSVIMIVFDVCTGR